MNKVEFCEKNVFFLVSPGTYWSKCYIERWTGRACEPCEPCNFFWYFGSEACGSEVRPKIAEFWTKNSWHDHGSGNVKWRQRRSRFAWKGHNWWRIMGIRLLRRNQSIIMPMETKWITQTEKSTSSSVKCQGFSHFFLWLSWRSASGVLTTRSDG